MKRLNKIDKSGVGGSGGARGPSKESPNSRENLAVNLQVARAILGWSQEQLGLKCGLKRTYIGTIERREINPGIDNLDKIATGMGIDSYMLILDPEHAQPLIYKAVRGH
ncbi:MAG: helix-turn-helix transcriptional regulator [Nevskia sp.]|nr:helix-turn-helix transcriptional regulator [Nevskia sp.]